MKIKRYRYFGACTLTQQNWLNRMAMQGWRLVKAGKLTYEFERCTPGAYQYAVDFVAHKSHQKAREYKDFLEELGYTVLPKNIQLAVAWGRVRLRPYGQGWGKLSTAPGSFNRELFLVEKTADGQPFALHTTREDKLACLAFQRNAFFNVVCLWLLGAALLWLRHQQPGGGFVLCLLLGAGFVLPVWHYQRQIGRLKRQGLVEE